jgi:hypothetical protein
VSVGRTKEGPVRKGHLLGEGYTVLVGSVGVIEGEGRVFRVILGVLDVRVFRTITKKLKDYPDNTIN